MRRKQKSDTRQYEKVSKVEILQNISSNPLNIVNIKHVYVDKEKNDKVQKRDIGKETNQASYMNVSRKEEDEEEEKEEQEKEQEQTNYFFKNINDSFWVSGTDSLTQEEIERKKNNKSEEAEKKKNKKEQTKNKKKSGNKNALTNGSNDEAIGVSNEKFNEMTHYDSNVFIEESNMKKKKRKKVIKNKKLKKRKSETKSKILKISKNIKNILNIMNLPKSDILEKTPNRLAKAFLHFVNGYNADIQNIVKNALYKRKYENYTTIKITGLHVYSLCKHHLLPFEGCCTIEYKPNKYILGLSKFSRIIDAYARRLQLQEDLTNDVCELLKQHLKPLYLVVTIKAKHMCVNMRGVKQHNSETITQAFCEWKNNRYVKSLTLKTEDLNSTPMKMETSIEEPQPIENQQTENENNIIKKN